MSNQAIRNDWLSVSDGHKLHLACYGNPQGKPVLWLHGGPGAGCLPGDMSLWDPGIWYVIMPDQRGAGLSIPSASLENNDFEHLLDDLEVIREHLGIDTWYVAGGSFGATLGLLYAGRYPRRVIQCLLWGLFIPSDTGVNWLYGESGAARYFPLAYDEFAGRLTSRLPELLDRFKQELASTDMEQRNLALNRWIGWEAELAMPGRNIHWQPSRRALAMASIQLHFATHRYFNGEALWRQTLKHLTVPCEVLQGENDWVCPLSLLRRALAPIPEMMQLTLVPGARHSLADERMHRAVTGAISQLQQARF